MLILHVLLCSTHDYIYKSAIFHQITEQMFLFQCTVAKKYSLVNDCTDADEQYGGDNHRVEKTIVVDNALKIEVYFENLRVRSITQTPAYEVLIFV